MIQHHIIFALSVLCLSTAAPTQPVAERASCASGIHMIVARGSLENPGLGKQANVTAAVQAAIPGSDAASVDYPAWIFPYDPSENQGVQSMTSMIKSYVLQCPSTPIALLGYSQGGQIVSDVLGGGSYNNTPPLDVVTYSKHIVAAVTFGDPSWVLGMSYDKGNATASGRFARTNTTALGHWASKLGAWCTYDDYWCASGNGSDANTVHAQEVATNGPAAANFIIDLFKNH